jgi:hypothetical protein
MRTHTVARTGEVSAAADARLLGEAAALEAVRVWRATRPRSQPVSDAERTAHAVLACEATRAH